jgi:hypothetical protein
MERSSLKRRSGSNNFEKMLETKSRTFRTRALRASSFRGSNKSQERYLEGWLNEMLQMAGSSGASSLKQF